MVIWAHCTRKDHEGKKGYKNVGFDGKHDFVATKNSKKSIVDNITLIDVSTGGYITHLQPPNGKGLTIASHIYDTLDKTESLQSIKSLHMDGTIVNTGQESGVHSMVEKAVGRPLQASVCLLHLVEICLRHIIERFDGGHVGPTTHQGNYIGTSSVD